MIGLIINQLNTATIAYKIHSFCIRKQILKGLYQLINGKEATNKPIAGMGTPVKCPVVGTELLKRAKRRAPKQANKNAGAGNHRNIHCMRFGHIGSPQHLKNNHGRSYTKTNHISQ